jgi:uncharacterized cofD-like protein
VVAVGGGHGLSASLRAIRRYAGEVTAVVSVADDGGSSGRLRRELPELPAPGDVRKCLGALASETSSIGAILEHRFASGDLAGHAFGNLMLVALSRQLGSFPAAVDAMAERVGAVGRVLPASTEAVALEALVPAVAGEEVAREDGMTVVSGQVAVHNSRGIRRVQLRPAAPSSPAAVAAAIGAAEQVVIGPGSLFTSVLAAAIVPGVHGPLAAAAAPLVYVANLGPQPCETEGFTVADEVAALRTHGIDVDVVVVDPRRVALDGGMDLGGVEVEVAEVSAEGTGAHDPERLGAVLARRAEVRWVGPNHVR